MRSQQPIYQQPQTFNANQGNNSNILDSMNLSVLVRAFQSKGYLAATLDPLNLQTLEEKQKTFVEYTYVSELDYRTYGFSEADLDREFLLQTNMITGVLSENKPMKLRDIISRLQKAYN